MTEPTDPPRYPSRGLPRRPPKRLTAAHKDFRDAAQEFELIQDAYRAARSRLIGATQRLRSRQEETGLQLESIHDLAQLLLNLSVVPILNAR